MNKIKLSRLSTLVGYFGLLIFIPVWHILVIPLDAKFMSITLLVQIGPLMFPLRGILHGRVYTHAWTMYLALFYFVIGVWYAGDESTRNFGVVFSLLSILFFIGTMLYTRYQGMANNVQNLAKSDTED
ncbi:MAG: DUF2069 domain-containing protein [Gammaproteobacteria bacterium]|nr:DUF2069 domain-containing protein [Gammaproteobacteria bacterium]